MILVRRFQYTSHQNTQHTSQTAHLDLLHFPYSEFISIIEASFRLLLYGHQRYFKYMGARIFFLSCFAQCVYFCLPYLSLLSYKTRIIFSLSSESNYLPTRRLPPASALYIFRVFPRNCSEASGR